MIFVVKKSFIVNVKFILRLFTTKKNNVSQFFQYNYVKSVGIIISLLFFYIFFTIDSIIFIIYSNNTHTHTQKLKNLNSLKLI